MDFVLGEMNLTDCKVGFEERDYSSLVQAAGLPADTPPELIFELIHALQKPNEAPVDVTEIVKQSRLWEYVQRTGEVASVIEKLVAIASPAFKAMGM